MGNHEEETLTQWQVLLIRLSIFPDPMSPIHYENWWTDLTGKESEQQTKKKLGGYIEEGTYEYGKLVLSIQPNRVDWFYRIIRGDYAIPPDDDEPETLGSYTKTISIFQHLINKWFSFETCPLIDRMALGLQAVYPVQSRSEGYIYLSSKLPVKINPNGSTDFIYQINRPQKSMNYSEDVEINRLMKWSVLRRQLGQVDLSSGTIIQTETDHSVLLELDINTSSETKVKFDCKNSLVVFPELIRLASEILIRGDYYYE